MSHNVSDPVSKLNGIFKREARKSRVVVSLERGAAEAAISHMPLDHKERSHLKTNTVLTEAALAKQSVVFCIFVVFNACHQQRLVCLAGFCLDIGL